MKKIVLFLATLAYSIPSTGNAQKPTKIGDWYRMEQVDRMDDSRSISYVTIRSDFFLVVAPRANGDTAVAVTFQNDYTSPACSGKVCTLRARFDTNQPEEYSFTSGAQTVMLIDFRKFVENVRTSTKVLIEIPMLRGSKIIEFSVKGLP